MDILTTIDNLFLDENSTPNQELKEFIQVEVVDSNDPLEKIVESTTFLTDDSIVNHPSKVTRVSARANGVNWDNIRHIYVLGKRKQLADGSYVSEDYTLKEIAAKFNVNYGSLRHKASQDRWNNLRKAYLARVNQINIGLDLGLYTQENYQSEIAALNACNKLGKVLDKYIEVKFGDILDDDVDVNSDHSLDDTVRETMLQVNRATGTPIFVTELKEAIKVAGDIYNLSRKIYENAPKEEITIIEEHTKKPKFRNDNERLAKIKQLEAKLGRAFTNVTPEP